MIFLVWLSDAFDMSHIDDSFIRFKGFYGVKILVIWWLIKFEFPKSNILFF